MKSHRLYNSVSIFQWFVFLLANSVALPVVIGGIFHMSMAEISTFMQRTFFVVGISSFLQGWLGHRYPIADGPAGSWVSVFVILAGVTLQNGDNLGGTLQLLEGGMIVAALLLILLGISGYMHRISYLFTPTVTGSFLLILAIQLSGVFMKGMMALHGDPLIPDYSVALLSFTVFVVVIVLSIKGKGWIKNFAVFIGILVGWLAYSLMGKSSSLGIQTDHWFQLPLLFAWGSPEWNSGIVLTSILFTFILVSNTIAAVSATTQAMDVEHRNDKVTLNRAGLLGGISHLFSSIFSTIGVVPLPITAGFIRMTGQKTLRPFLAACLIFTSTSLLPGIVNFLALLPVPVATAALLASFVQMIGISFQNIVKETLDQRKLTILGITLLISVGIMFLPTSVFQGLPPILQYVCSNALLVGTLLVILLEQLWKKGVSES